MTLWVLVLALATGCAGYVGSSKMTVAGQLDEMGGVEVPETTTECKGIYFAFGQSDTCGVEGGALSVPGLALGHNLLCGVLSYFGREPSMCEAPPGD